MLYIYRLFKRIDAGLIIAAALSLFIIESLLQTGLPVAADIPIHLYRMIEYERSWAVGVIIPRWSPNFAFGYGYPIFIFAPPLPYLLGMLFHLMGVTYETALKLLIILTILLYATGMYLLGRDTLKSPYAGLIAATIYSFSPFALRESLLYGGNIPQLLAIGLYPYTLWAMTRAAYTRSWGWTVLSTLCYTAILLTHLFHALIFTVVAGLYGLFLAYITYKKKREIIPSSSFFYHITKHTSLPLLTIPAGLLLSAFFWIPALTEMPFTRATADIFRERSPFFIRYPHWTELTAWIKPLDVRAANPYVPLTIGTVTIILATMGLLAGIWLVIKKDKNFSPPFILFFASLTAAAIFLIMPVSRPVWEIIPLLQMAEFPWRFLGLANLGLAFLAGISVIALPRKVRLPFTVICIISQIVTTAPLLYPVTPFAKYGQPTIADQINYERRTQAIGTTTLGEYLPQTVEQPPKNSPLVEQFQAGLFPERLDRSSLPPKTTANLLKQNAVTHSYQLNGSDSFTLRLFQFVYPGWQAMLDGQEIKITPEPKTGLMLINIPPGQHNLTVHFGDTPTRTAAMLLSVVTAIVMATVTFYFKGRGQNEKWQGAVCSAKLSVILPVIILIIGLSFWLKPVLRPLFTIHSPPDKALPAQHQVEIDFKNGIQLIGYDINKKILSPGGLLQITLYWQTNSAPHKSNLQPFVHLDRLNNYNTVAGSTNYTPGDVTTESNMPTFHWDNTRYVRDEHELIIPSDIPPIAYAVRVGLIDPDKNSLITLAGGNENEDTAQLTIINISPKWWRKISPPNKLDISLSNQQQDTIYLTGFKIEPPATDQLDFTLYWQTARVNQNDYTIFAQLLDENQNLAAGFDQPPLNGAYPTSTWLAGQTIIDSRYIPLQDVLPGKYRLIVGAYNPLTGQRLRTAKGVDFVELSPSVIVEQ